MKRPGGINRAFDPWLAKWKIVAELKFPIKIQADRLGNDADFLLLKGTPRAKKFDLDEQLNKNGGASILCDR